MEKIVEKKETTANKQASDELCAANMSRMINYFLNCGEQAPQKQKRIVIISHVKEGK